MQTRTPPPAGDAPPPPYTRVIRRVYPYSLRPLVIGISIFGLIWGAAVGVSNIQDVGDEGGEIMVSLSSASWSTDPCWNTSHEEDKCVLGCLGDHVLRRGGRGTIRHGGSDSGKTFFFYLHLPFADVVLLYRPVAKAQGGSTVCCYCPSRCTHRSGGGDSQHGCALQPQVRLDPAVHSGGDRHKSQGLLWQCYRIDRSSSKGL